VRKIQLLVAVQGIALGWGENFGDGVAGLFGGELFTFKAHQLSNTSHHKGFTGNHMDIGGPHLHRRLENFVQQGHGSFLSIPMKGVGGEDQGYLVHLQIDKIGRQNLSSLMGKDPGRGYRDKILCLVDEIGDARPLDQGDLAFYSKLAGEDDDFGLVRGHAITMVRFYRRLTIDEGSPGKLICTFPYYPMVRFKYTIYRHRACSLCEGRVLNYELHDSIEQPARLRAHSGRFTA
jgi:hypothetical protein